MLTKFYFCYTLSSKGGEKMSIAANIKNLRERFGLTQEQLGEIAGATDKAVSTWEKGKAVPRMGAIQRMADHFGISKSDIIEDKEEKPIPEDELDNELINLLSDLTPQETVRVIDFVAGLKAARAGEVSPHK
jgi:transcriptional regulator with XRE-family HTH domain